MKKVLIVVSSISNSGGVSMVVKEFITGLHNKNINVDIICYDTPNESDMALIKGIGSNLFIIDRVSKGVLRYINNIKNIISLNGKYDAIHIHTSLFIWMAAYAARKSGVSTVIGHAHGSKFLNYPEFIINLIKIPCNILNRIYCSKMLACENKAGEFTFGKNYEVFKNFIDVTPNVDIERIYCLKDKLGIINSKEYSVIGNAGRIGGVKNPEFLLDLFKEYRKVNDKCYLLFIGSGEREEKMRQLVEIYKLEEWVKFSGDLLNVKDIMNIFNVYVNTSLSEGLSISLLEAQSKGVKCLVSKNVSTDTDIGSGLFVRCDTYNIEEWIAKLEYLINNKNMVSYNIILANMQKNRVEKSYAIDKFISECGLN